MPSHIEWTDYQVNPWSGCDHVSEECDNCYIERQIPFRVAGRKFDPSGHIALEFHMERLHKFPMTSRKPLRLFMCGSSDLFHKDASDDRIAQVFAAMRQYSLHSYQCLTKRPQRMAKLLSSASWWSDPLPNVWLGTSIGLDKYCWRADYVRKTPAAIRWLSLEPLLGPLPSLDLTDIDWCIVGGESGPNYRAMDLAWLESVANQCERAGVPLFVKQDHGKYPGRQGRIPSYLWALKEFPR